MVDVERENPAWTARKVEAKLIAAFRPMPSLPVFASGPRGQDADPLDQQKPGPPRTRLEVAEPSFRGDVAGWAALLKQDEGGRKALWNWARCRATRTSFGELCQVMGWPRTTAERARRRAAATIAEALAR